MQLDDLDFTDELALLSQMQQQMQEKTNSVAAASAAVGLNMHKGKSNTECTNPIKIDGEDLEDKHLELKATVNQHQGHDFQYRCQDSSTVWSRNLKNYESHHPENTGVY
ncbi:unnamed protein product [Schistosoma mattheei]|uniref:Uncharacterized protein n=1 Tax=Schistosoma mattheei TaxID=31246 RepID=A0A183NUA8_9TREM|nr:unnamed protein product [Schistosoma mattheei]